MIADQDFPDDHGMTSHSQIQNKPSLRLASSPHHHLLLTFFLSMAAEKDNYIVIGGSGFLGRHIVEALLNRGDSVSVLDIVQRYHDVPFYSADISVQSQVEDAFRKVTSNPLLFFLSLRKFCFRVGPPVSFIPPLHLMASTLLSIGK